MPLDSNHKHNPTMKAATRPIPQLSESDKERFFAKISPVPTSDGCLEWTAGRYNTGYGQFYCGGKTLGAHRLAYFLATGIDPVELCCCHHCDNPACVNPEHIFLGTDKDNALDKVRKGRCNPATGNRNGSRLHPESRPRGDRHGSITKPERIARGERHGSITKPDSVPRGDRHYSRTKPDSVPRGAARGQAKLTESQIIAIREDNRSQSRIALDYNVSQTLIGGIKNRKRWSHID